MEEGSRVWNTKAVRLFSLRIIGEVDILLFLQGNDNEFLIYCCKLGELYSINSLINEKIIIWFLPQHSEMLLGKIKTKVARAKKALRVIGEPD